MHTLSRLAWPLIGTSGVALLGGCALIYNFEDYSRGTSSGAGEGGASSSGVEAGTGAAAASGGGSTSSTPGSGSGGNCNDGAECLKPPDGWTAVAFQSPSELGTACPNGFTEKDRGGVGPQGAASCEPCSCGPGTCDTVFFQLYTMLPDCTQASKTFMIPPNTCGSVGGVTPYSAYHFSVSSICQPSGGMNTTLPTWSMESRTCVPTGAGSCSGGQCFPPLLSPFELCISRPGDALCPNPSSMKRVFYTAFTNTTSCSACTCGKPPCMGTTILYSDFDCKGTSLTPLKPNNMCTKNLVSTTLQSVKTDYTAPACPPIGGAPSGNVSEDPSTAVTVCCPP